MRPVKHRLIAAFAAALLAFTLAGCSYFTNGRPDYPPPQTPRNIP
jgi:hypothetical protein